MAALLLTLLTACARTPVYDPERGYAFYKFASAAYCPPRDEWECAPCVSSNRTKLNLLWLRNTEVQEMAYVGAFLRPNHSLSEVELVLSFRGTENLQNWIENLDIAKTDHAMSCDGCKAHSGFVKVWAAFRQPVVAELIKLRSPYPAWHRSLRAARPGRRQPAQRHGKEYISNRSCRICM